MIGTIGAVLLRAVFGFKVSYSPYSWTRHLYVIVILILPSDTLFGEDFYCICLDHPNREAAVLSTHSPQPLEKHNTPG